MQKTISELASLVSGAVVVGDGNTVITNIERDSREARRGTLFACIPGVHVDGNDFIPQAAAQGAAAVITDEDAIVPDGLAGIRVPDVQEALKAIVPAFYDHPADKMRVIGITGTNGKTTTSYMIRSMLRKAGYKVGLIGTIQIMIEDKALEVHNTTPDIVELYKTLSRMHEEGMDYVVMEVSSHALAMDRVSGIEFDTAVFTNLTQDHLDFHKTMENYMLAKAKLFDKLGVPGHKSGKTAVVNIDDEAGSVMLEHAKCDHMTYSVSHDGASLKAEDVNVESRGMKFTIEGGFGSMELSLHITGIFNVYNVLASVGAALAEQVSPSIIKAALTEFHSVPGRFEIVDAGQDFTIIVDYAHTPDGLENVLNTAREVAKKRVITVFGCGGDRDRTKRPKMGRIAASLSDVVISTSDNPRSEDPEFILDEVEKGVAETLGVKQHERISDRKKAIFRAAEIAEPDDIVVIAGKGHEDYQILNDRTIHFDDRETARAAVAALKGRN